MRTNILHLPSLQRSTTVRPGLLRRLFRAGLTRTLWAAATKSVRCRGRAALPGVLVFALLITAVAASAQAADPPQPDASASSQREVQRQRIERERAQAQALLDAQRATCQKRFAVVDCTRDAQERHNRTMGDLRRQEVLLNDEERRSRVDAKHGDLEQRGQRQQDREQQQQDPMRAEQSKPATQPAGSGPKDIEAHQREQSLRRAQRDAEAARRVEQAQRQREDAEDRRKRARQREAERQDTPAAPLPIPP